MLTEQEIKHLQEEAEFYRISLLLAIERIDRLEREMRNMSLIGLHFQPPSLLEEQVEEILEEASDT